jgi:hypothetical protein
MLFLRILTTTLFLTVFFLVVQSVEAVKPMAPLEITLELGGIPQVGRELPVFVKVVSMVDVPQARVGFTLPAGVEMVSEQGVWEGELATGSLKQITFNLRVKEPGRHVIRATATIEYPGGAKISKGAALLIDLGGESSLGIESKQKTEPKRRTPTIRKGKDGQYIGEFPLD